jgi:hypothetical protein
MGVMQRSGRLLFSGFLLIGFVAAWAMVAAEPAAASMPVKLYVTFPPPAGHLVMQLAVG